MQKFELCALSAHEVSDYNEDLELVVDDTSYVIGDSPSPPSFGFTSSIIRDGLC